MWILSTFDRNYRKKSINEAIKKFWPANVIVLRKSKYFLWTKSVIPFLIRTILLLIIIIFLFKYIQVQRFLIMSISIFVASRISLNIKVVKNLLDYTMDFIIVTPRSFVRYDQEWLFKRLSKTIDLKKIRSISIRKRGFRNSIFNNGTLIVLSEWWEAEQNEKFKAGEIVFRYLYDPEHYNQKINDFLSEVFTK